MTGGPLEGVRVVDIASVVAGPSGARHLADLGADVIKVEPPGGDPARSMGWCLPEDDDSLFWKILGRGKRCITLDLKSPEGRADLRRILGDADVLIENMRPGKLERLGLDPADLLAANPRLVVVRVTGFGQDGPYADHPGFATIAEAMSGFASLCGMPDGPPLLAPVALTDEVTGFVTAFAAVSAVLSARSTGRGQVVDVNLLDTILQVLGPLPAASRHLGYEQGRMGSQIPYTVPRGTYRCSDGVWVAVSSSAETIAQRVLGLVGLAGDPRMQSFQGRVEHRDEIERLLQAFVAARSSDEVLAAFRDADAAIAKVASLADVVADPHVIERESVREVDGILMQAPVARFSETPSEVRHAGRALDADGPAIRDDPWPATEPIPLPNVMN